MLRRYKLIQPAEKRTKKFQPKLERPRHYWKSAAGKGAEKKAKKRK